LFDYARGAPFAVGAHRGADFAAQPGATVRAACDGIVAYSGPAPGGRVVTLRCGTRRVTHLPLARVTVRRGARIAAGTSIGTLAAGHDGLHLGVRTASDPFGYEDPLALLPPQSRPRPLPPAPPPSRRFLPPLPPAAVPAPGARPLSPPAVPAPAGRPLSPPAAPPLAWAGLTLVLLGAAGTGTVRVRHRRRDPRVRVAAGASRSG
jgi:murein DD-endopeptidase MepM/ murein hydrolase activator NlpD